MIATKEKKAWQVILDKTCFFTEGGGQHIISAAQWKMGLVKAIGVEEIRGNARISWKIGERYLIKMTHPC